MVDEDLAAAQFGQPRKDIVAHRMVDEQEILLGDPQFLQPPDAPGQRRIQLPWRYAVMVVLAPADGTVTQLTIGTVVFRYRVRGLYSHPSGSSQRRCCRA